MIDTSNSEMTAIQQRFSAVFDNHGDHRLLAIDGQDGTGKTSVINELKKINEDRKLGIRFEQALPEGYLRILIRAAANRAGRERYLTSVVNIQSYLARLRGYSEDSIVVSDRGFLTHFVYDFAPTALLVERDHTVKLFDELFCMGGKIPLPEATVVLKASVDVRRQRLSQKPDFNKQDEESLTGATDRARIRNMLYDAVPEKNSIDTSYLTARQVAEKILLSKFNIRT